MKAIILAGGKGTRLAPYTTVLPKPLMPIGDIPILEIVIRQLAYHGFNEIVVAVGYLAELIMAYCGDGSKYRIKISYSHEATPLGTAGPISIIPNLTETFLLMNGDLLTTLDYYDMWRYHLERGAIATLATYQREVETNLGVIERDADNWVTDYIEKPKLHYTVSCGIYIFEPSILKYIEPRLHLDLPELILRLLRREEKVNDYNYDGCWLDIGRYEDYQEAIKTFESNKRKFLPQD